MLSDLDPSEIEVSQTLGRFVITWNRVEGAIISLLQTLIPVQEHAGWMRSAIVVSRLDTTGVVDALRSIAKANMVEDQGDAVKNAADFFDRLRPYRNYYVHGITGGRRFTDAGVVGIISYLDARGTLKHYHEMLKIEAITNATSQAEELIEYINKLQYHLKPGFDEDPGMHPLPALLQLPEPCTKPQRPLQSLPPQP